MTGGLTEGSLASGWLDGETLLLGGGVSKGQSRPAGGLAESIFELDEGIEGHSQTLTHSRLGQRS